MICRSNPALPNKETLEYLYYTEKLSISKIAIQFNITFHIMRSLFLQYNILASSKHSRVDLDKNTLNQAIELYDNEKRSKRYITSKLKIPAGSLDRAFLECGKQFRNNAGSGMIELLPQKEIHDYYVIQKKSLKDTRNHFKTSMETVKLILKKYNVPIRKNQFTFGRQTVIDGITYKSTWETAFKILNLHNNNLEYETISIWYNKLGKKSRYFVDFADHKAKKLYEIKPNFKLKDDIIKAKIAAANEWCQTNGYTYNIITEDYFRSMSNEQKIKLQDYQCLTVLNGMKEIGIKFATKS